MKSITKAVMVTMLGISVSFAAPKPKAKAISEAVLAPGAYSAQVKGIVCGGCGQLIQQTLEKFNGIEKVAVNQDEKTVNFQVRKGSKLKLSEIQKALQASAGKMGMGADYTLQNLKKVG
ncbi:MAG: hypothetical protein A2901_02355 [Elusimicrobia bacterium RIFCSPLOWO2_01_FULL_54_10]|nr:MAG: hypothetical protein A2901_02355 [Elusimicrobia bacterium RIFCSPLOWO2_01_FULL_54_10]